MTPETIVHANGVDLCVQEFGDRDDPAILLIGGAASSMDWWEDEFCERLAAYGRRVVRYDFRDTGRSVSSPAGKPDYDGGDLTDDTVALIDVLGLAPVHLAGISMGGAIAQEIALDHPEKVATLTTFSTTLISGGPDLPGMSPELSKSFAEPGPQPDWSDRDAAVEHIVGGLELFAGRLGVDRARATTAAGRMVDRTTDVAASQTNHWILGDPARRTNTDLGAITAPALVVHGTDDPLFPVAHGEALAAAIPGARFLPLPGVGHEVPPEPVWDTVVPALAEHTAPRV